jgi:hypothetical protein
MVAILRQIVKVEPGGVARVQSDQLREGAVAEVLVTINTVETDRAFGSTWKTFIGAGVGGGRSVEEIDGSIRELRDEWPQ